MPAMLELVFDPNIIPSLIDTRGKIWQDFLGSKTNWIEETPEQIALALLLARLNNCATCTTNSYRSMQGCECCTRQTLKRYRGSDQELILLFHAALSEVSTYLEKNNTPEKIFEYAKREKENDKQCLK